MEIEKITRTLRQEYGFVRLVWKEHLGGLSSSNIAFDADGASYVLKQYGEMARAQLSRLEAIAMCLQQHGFPAPEPLLNRADQRHVLCDGDAFAVFVRAKGRILHQGSLNATALESTAKLLSRLHRLGEAAQQWLLLARPQSPLGAQSLQMLEDDLQTDARQNPWRDLVLESLQIKKRLQSINMDRELNAWVTGRDFVHGDFHNENILYNELSQATSVLDYEESYLGHGICDAINFVQFACCNRRIDANGLSAGRHFLGNYLKAKPCSHADVRLGWANFFARTAASTFLERGLLAGEAFFADLVRRDIKKMELQLRDGAALVEAVLP